MTDINLLPVEEKSAAKFEAIRRRLTVVSVVFLIATAIFTLGTLIMYTSLVRRRADLVDQAEGSLTRINSLKANEELIVVIKGKTSSASSLLDARTNTAGVFEKLAQLTPQGVYFTDMRFTSGKVVMSGKAKSSADVSGLVSSLTSSAGSGVVSDIAVDSLSSNETGNYSFVISAQLVGK